MALSTGVATTGSGAMALNAGTALGGTALANPQPFSNFEVPHSAGPTSGATGANSGGRGATGAFDMRSWERKEEIYEDMHACLGVDIGTSTIKACLYLRDGGSKPVGKNPLPACVLVDPKSGVKGVRRWLKARSAPGAGPATAPPKGVTLFYDPRQGGSVGNRPASEDDKCAVVWPLRLLALKGSGAAVAERVQSALRHEIKVSSEDSHDTDDAETSGVRLLLKSPNAVEAKDKEIWIAAEEVVAMLLAGVKAKAQDTYNVTLVTCNVSAPSCLGDLHRVALQRSVFLAGLVPGRFVGAPLAATVGHLWGRSTSELKQPDDLVVSIGMGSSFLDVAVMSAVREASPSSAVLGDDPVPPAASSSSGKKRKGKGNTSAVRDDAMDALEFKVKAVCGDPACGGLDMDYRVARALLAAVEDSSGSEIASDRVLWFNLLEAAEALRERLTTDPKWSFTLKPGCCERDPEFKQSVEMSQSEMEGTVAGTLETFRKALQTALERAGAFPGQVKSVVLYGSCTNTPSVHDEVLKTFSQAHIAQATPGDCAKGAALLLADERDLLTALPVKGSDALPHKLALVDRSKQGVEPIELFPKGTPIPGFVDHLFSRKTGGLEIDVEVVQWVEPCAAAAAGRKSNKKKAGSGGGAGGGGGRWVTVQRLGNPLTMQDENGYPVLAEEVTMRFSVDKCGICVNEVESSVLPKKKDKNGPFRTFLNRLMAVLAVLAVLGGGYYMLYRLEHAGERRQENARVRLTAFYQEHNPDKLDTVEDTLQRYKGREDVLFQRLKKQYGKPVPRK